MEKDKQKHNIDSTIDKKISLEEIAEIVEMHIKEDENIPEYDGYDISIDELENELQNEKNLTKKENKESRIKDKKDKNKEIKDKTNKKPINDKIINNETTNKKTINNKIMNNEIVNKKTLNNKIINNETNNKISTNDNKIIKNKISKNLTYLNNRHKFIDIIIGISIISIILSSGVGIYNELPQFLTISKWNGITFADLGLPSFILALCFMIPTEIELDLKNRLNFKEIIIKKIKFGLSLILIGIILNILISGGASNFRIMGILQFIGIIYIIVSLIYIALKKVKFKINVIGCILIIIGISGTFIYFLISNKFGNEMNRCFAHFVDSKLLYGHFYGFERLGIVATLSAIFAGMLSAAGGCFICDKRSNQKEKSTKILIVGMAFIIISLILERRCPYNVNIWSPSFVTLISGGFLILSSFMMIVFDDRKTKLDLIFYPFIILGSSSIFLIALNEILINTLLKVKVYSISMASMIEVDDWIIVDLLSAIFGKGSRVIAFLVIYILILFAASLFIYGKKLYKEKNK